MNYTRHEQTISFFRNGKECIESAEHLFNNKKPQYDILLFHGVELLLKSFILYFDKQTTNSSLKNKFGHNYLDILKHCEKIDKNKVLSGKLIKSIKLLDRYSPSIVEIRYPSKSQLRELHQPIFDDIKKYLVNPFKKYLVTPDGQHYKDEI